jgi:DNA-binding IclR family transcriptional regulator
MARAIVASGKVSSATVLSAGTTFRLLCALVRQRYAEGNQATAILPPGVACLPRARAFQTGNEMRSVALSAMQQLRDATMETLHPALLDPLITASQLVPNVFSSVRD